MSLHPSLRATCSALALALSLAISGAAFAQEEPSIEADHSADAVDMLPSGQEVSQTVIDLAGWVKASKDTAGYPFAVIDKVNAQILVFGGDGKLKGAAPALFGLDKGDTSDPGVVKYSLNKIPKGQRTTPAGSFVGGYGPSMDTGRVLWMDFDTAVSIHPTATGVKSERRPERLASPEPDDNRITNGCINVDPEFYAKVIKPTFEKGGLFYVLPEETEISKVFPDFAKSQATAQRTEGKRPRRERADVQDSASP